MRTVYDMTNYQNTQLIGDSDPIPTGFTDIKPMKLNDDGKTYTGLYKPVWSNGVWGEGATAEEITAINTPADKAPSLEQQQIAQLLLITAQQTQQIAALQAAQAGGAS